MRKLTLFFIVLVAFTLFLINPAVSQRRDTIKNVSWVNITISLYAFDFENREASCWVQVKIQADEFHDKPIKVNIVSRDALWLEMEPHSSKSLNKTYYIKSGILKSYFVINGFYYPFDSIVPHLRIDLPFNVTKDKIKIECFIHDAYVRNVYEKGKLYLNVENSSLGSTVDISIELDRKFIWSLPVMIPLAIGYLILGASTIMQRKDTSTHLRVYLSVLTISLTLFFSIKDALPLRSTLSIAEILILTLMTSTSIFIICYMLNRNLAEASVISAILIELPFAYLIWNYRFTEIALNGYFVFSLLICMFLLAPPAFYQRSKK